MFTLLYRSMSEYVPVDIEALRPKESYGHLMRRRTHSIDNLISKYGKIPHELLVHRSCPTCGAVDDYTAELKKDHMELVRCNKCDLVYTNPIFDEEHYTELYQTEDYQEIVRKLGFDSHEYRKERFGMERVKLMSDQIPASIIRPVYLDVGCSTGFVVEAAQDVGWEAYGIDLNPSAIQFGRERGLQVTTESLEEVTFEDASFDAISLFDVIEHIPNPNEVFHKVKRLLKPGGIVLLYVPNYDSASRFLMGSDAHFIWPTHHLNYYTPATICSFMVRHSFHVEFLATEGLDIADYIWHEENVNQRDTSLLKDIADKLQFFVNAGAYGKNLRAIGRKSSGR